MFHSVRHIIMGGKRCYGGLRRLENNGGVENPYHKYICFLCVCRYLFLYVMHDNRSSVVGNWIEGIQCDCQSSPQQVVYAFVELLFMRVD